MRADHEETNQLGEQVRSLRQQRGFSVRGLAGAAGVDATWLSRLEHGLYSSPDARSLSKLARALEVDASDLYLTAGYGDGTHLPGLRPYLRAKYDLPPEAVAQLEAHLDLLNEHYLRQRGPEGGGDG